jgi:hypothetical protein
MKRKLKGGGKLMFLVLLLITGVRTYAQPVISGTIADLDSQNVINHIVEITTDTIGVPYPYYAIDSTDADGNYSFTLPQNLPVGIHFVVKTTSCGQPATETILYPYSSNNTDFTICPVNRYLKGNVYKGGMPADQAMAYLIRRSYDTMLNDYVIELQDTMHTDANGGFLFFLPVSSPDSYLVKAALLPEDTLDYVNFIPSYFMGELQWSQANHLPNANGQIDIQLSESMNMQGQGYIAGTLEDSSYKRILLLTTDNDIPVAYRYSDMSGGFSFGGLNYGGYKLFGDVWGKSNPPLSFSLSANASSITTIVFHETGSAFFGTLFPLSVNIPGLEGQPTVYPNPVSDYLHIKGLDKIEGEKSIILCNVSGAEVYNLTVNDNSPILVPFTELSSGLYFLQINSATGSIFYKIVK